VFFRLIGPWTRPISPRLAGAGQLVGQIFSSWLENQATATLSNVDC
jgi:hypothetical protein